jgi:hypothetical protein
MATIFIAKHGNNANSGLTLALAKRTMFDSGVDSGAYELAVDGDTILFDDGVYTPSEIESSAGLGYFTNQKSIFIDSVNAYGATLQSSSTVAVYRVSAAMANKTAGFGPNGINLGGGSVVQNDAILLTPTAGPFTFDLGAVRVTTATFYPVNITSANTVEIHLLGSPDLTSNRGGIDALTLGNNSSITLSSPIARCLVKQVGRAMFNFVATGAGVKVTLLEPKVEIEHFAAFPAQQDYGISIKNVDSPLVYKPEISLRTLSATGTAYGVHVDCDNVTYPAHRAKVIGGTVDIDVNGGIAVLIGHDGANAYDNTSNNGFISGTRIVGGLKFRDAPSAGHGVMQGSNQNGLTTGIDIVSSGIGLLFKRTTGAKAVGGRTRNCKQSHLQLKGCTNTSMDGVHIYLDGNVGVGLIANADGATNNTGCTATGNIFHASGAISGKLVDIQASQDVTMYQSVYNILDTAVLPATVISKAGVNYSSLSTAIAAIEPTASIVNEYVIEDKSDHVGRISYQLSENYSMVL